MTLPNGDVLHDMRVAANPSPYTVYDVDLAENFEKIDTNFGLQELKLAQLAQADVGLAADAVGNISNMLVNGNFKLAFCSPLDESGAVGAVPPLSNPAGIKLVQWCDCWWVDEDAVDALDVQTVDIPAPPGPGEWFDPEEGLVLKRGSGSGVYTGAVFQRVDLHTDLDNLRGRTVTLGVLYNAVTDDEFYLEIDDGVTTSDNSLVVGGPSPAGLGGQSRLTHTVDALASKLTVKIVLQVDAPALDADALVIVQAYMRAGVAPVQLPVAAPPADTARDMFVAQMFTKFMSWGEGAANPMCLPSTLYTITGLEHFTDVTKWDVPLINDGANTQIGTFYTTVFTLIPGDPRDLSLPGIVGPTMTLFAARRTMMNKVSGDLIASSGFYSAGRLAIARAPLILPEFGFVADDLSVFVNVIPDA